METNSDFPIPARVQVMAAIMVKQSHFPNAGRGVFAKEKIKKAQEIFKIAKPRIMTAHSEFASDICDNCWALVNPLNPTVQIQSGVVKLLACKGCKVVYYCDKKCQEVAWRHHHRLECACLGALKAEVFVDNGSILDIPNLRSLVQLLKFQQTREQRSRVSDEMETREYELLQTNRKERENDEVFKKFMEEICGVLAGYTNFNVEGVKEYFCGVSNNQLTVHLPILQGNCGIDEHDRPLLVNVGGCVEPFVALINHSCVANASISFNGTELRIWSVKDIDAGDELTISYTYPNAEYMHRQEELLKHHCFQCSCALCKEQGKLGRSITPTGALRELVDSLMDIGTPKSDFDIKELEVGIAIMKARGFGYERYPMRQLHWFLIAGYVNSGENLHMAMKTALLLYFFIERAQIPPTCYQERLETLGVMIKLMEQTQSAPSFPLHVRTRLCCQLRHIYVMQIETIWGKDSIVAQYERQSFDQDLLRNMGAKFTENFKMLIDSKVDYLKYIESANMLLEFFDLPEISEEDMFWDVEQVRVAYPLTVNETPVCKGASMISAGVDQESDLKQETLGA